MAKRRVVLTGAAGYVAKPMFKELSERWDLVPIDVRPTTRDGRPALGVVVADLTNPDWYGWAKAAYELLGFVFATGKVEGSKLEIVQWRIGGPRDDDIDQVKPGDIKVMHRALGAYLSRRDQIQQATRMVEAEDIADEHGVPLLVVYGISGNTHRFWSIANAREKIGYEPEDDSQINFADKIAAIARAAKR